MTLEGLKAHPGAEISAAQEQLGNLERVRGELNALLEKKAEALQVAASVISRMAAEGTESMENTEGTDGTEEAG
jgi:hypothetical protein